MSLKYVIGSERKTAEASTTPAYAMLYKGYAMLRSSILRTFNQKNKSRHIAGSSFNQKIITDKALKRECTILDQPFYYKNLPADCKRDCH